MGKTKVTNLLFESRREFEERFQIQKQVMFPSITLCIEACLFAVVTFES